MKNFYMQSRCRFIEKLNSRDIWGRVCSENFSRWLRSPKPCNKFLHANKGWFTVINYRECRCTKKLSIWRYTRTNPDQKYIFKNSVNKYLGYVIPDYVTNMFFLIKWNNLTCTYWHSFKELESIANQAKPNLQMNANSNRKISDSFSSM